MTNNISRSSTNESVHRSTFLNGYYISLELGTELIFIHYHSAISLSDTFICFQLCSIKYYLELCSIYNLLYNIPHANFQFICFT